MNLWRRINAVSVRTKVLVPVIAVMVLLVGASMWLVNQRIIRQVQVDAAQHLATAEVYFRNTERIHADELFLRYRNVVNEPRFKAVLGTMDLKTFDHLLVDFVNDGVANAIVLATTGGQRSTRTRDPRLDPMLFEASCADSIAQALSGQPKVDTVRNGDRLFDIVSIPIRVADEIVGAVSFGTENSIAQEFNQLTRSELVLVVDGRMMTSTHIRPEWQPALQAQYERMSTNEPVNRNPISEISLGDEHFLCITGRLTERNRGHQLGYLILSSYEKQLQALRSMQRMILLVSTLAILLGTAVVWFVIRKVTKPLRELRDSAEAVGRGDFSRRVAVRYEDECGELARVFNQMTQNLKSSREQLEMTVETLKTTQAQLIQSEKLSGIGEFIAGVAHELNNPLTSVMGFSELLQQSDGNPKNKRHLEMIFKSAMRCQKIVQALLGFARRRSPERKPVCLNGLVEASVEILQYQLRTGGIEVITRLDPNLPQAMVDPHQVQQVFVNVINNARQAIEAHQPKGWIKVTTETHGDNVQVTIEDNGPGIAEENLSKIFDPFFTTKKVGEGTGLGLSLCYGIIKEHGGTITPRARPGEGAMFIIELPIAHGVSEIVVKARREKIDRPDPSEGAGKKVLVIDDEESILQMVREALCPRGYEVDVAPDGEAALRQLSRKHYDLTLCDWKMPGLNGQDVYERLRAINPALSDRMIFITGDVITEKTHKFLEEQNKVCLPKPFTLVEFRTAIRKVLARK